MDPDHTLEEMLSLSKDMIKVYEDEESNGIDQDDAYRLAELVLALNEWLMVKNGFLPQRWNGSNLLNGEPIVADGKVVR